MAYRLEIHPEATSDGRAAYAWYKERSSLVAEAFVAELDLAIERLQSSPLTWPSHVHGSRRYLLRRFPYGIVYFVDSEVVRIVAVAHTRRRPGYWKARLAR